MAASEPNRYTFYCLLLGIKPPTSSPNVLERFKARSSLAQAVCSKDGLSYKEWSNFNDETITRIFEDYKEACLIITNESNWELFCYNICCLYKLDQTHKALSFNQGLPGPCLDPQYRGQRRIFLTIMRTWVYCLFIQNKKFDENQYNDECKRNFSIYFWPLD